MFIKVIAHTQLEKSFRNDRAENIVNSTDGQAVALTAIRTCYSANKPSEIIEKEGAKYFGKAATDGEGGSEADRLFRHIVRSGHTSTLEHITFTFSIEGVSRALLAQLTRHRVGFSYSVQSQRYVRFGSKDKAGGMTYVTPATCDGRESPTLSRGKLNDKTGEIDWTPSTASEIFEDAMRHAQGAYDQLRAAGVPAEDARAVLPNAATCNLVMTASLRGLIEFYRKRQAGKGAQAEIAELAERLRTAVEAVEPWTGAYFDQVAA